MMTTRRKLIQSIGAAGVLGAFPMIARSAELLPKSGRRVVIVGGGFGGAMAAKQCCCPPKE